MRMGIAALVLAATLAGCSGDGSEPGGDELTEATVDCDRFEDTASEITAAQQTLYAGRDGTGDTEAIDTLVDELEQLEDGTPDDVEAALRDMADAFRDAEELLDRPTPAKKQQLAELAPELAEDGQTITAYFTSHCD